MVLGAAKGDAAGLSFKMRGRKELSGEQKQSCWPRP